MKAKQIKTIKEWLKKEYGENHFSTSDLKKMEFGDDGTVYIGFTQIKTGIELQNN